MKLKESINYIVSGYPGRHSHHKYFPYTYGDCIIWHLIELTKYKHNLDTITVVINQYECENLVDKKRFFYFLKMYKQIYNNVDILFRENKYVSYGGFVYAFENRKKDYNKYILMEYDYSFCIDDFDINLSKLQNDNNHDAMFAVWTDIKEFTCGRWIEYPEHGAISLAILNHNCFYQTYKKCKDTMRQGQYVFTRSFLDCGFKCGDWRNYYKIKFYNGMHNYLTDYSLPTSKHELINLLQDQYLNITLD